jgi:hypothetical protein
VLSEGLVLSEGRPLSEVMALTKELALGFAPALIDGALPDTTYSFGWSLLGE